MSHHARGLVHMENVSIQGQTQSEPAPPYTAEMLPPSFDANEHPITSPTLRPQSPVIQPASIRWSSWREMEAKDILHSEEFNLIAELLRFRLYGTKECLRQTLKHLWTFRLNNILGIFQDSERQSVETSKEQKVDRILSLVEPCQPSSDLVSTWRPDQASNQEPTQIALEINDDSRSLFERVGFDNWVRLALGYEEDSVQRVFTQHGCISVRIRYYLHDHPTERLTYLQVGQHLQSQNPLAHQAVAIGLLPFEDPIEFSLEDICEPITGLFQDNRLSLKAILLRLPLLAQRFDRTYHREILSEWPRFSTETDIFDALLTNPSPFECAKSMTRSDKSDFDLLCLEDFKSHGPHLTRMNTKWNSICGEFVECYKTYPLLTFQLDMVAQALRHYRNWYRLTALLCGRSEARPEDFAYSSLANPNDNYAVCRAEMKEHPGLPFLFPLFRQYCHSGDSVISEVFAFLSYSVEGVSASQARRPLGQFMARKKRIL